MNYEFWTRKRVRCCLYLNLNCESWCIRNKRCSTIVPVGTRLHLVYWLPTCMGRWEVQLWTGGTVWPTNFKETGQRLLTCTHLRRVPPHSHTHTLLYGKWLSTGPHWRPQLVVVESLITTETNSQRCLSCIFTILCSVWWAAYTVRRSAANEWNAALHAFLRFDVCLCHFHCLLSTHY